LQLIKPNQYKNMKKVIITAALILGASSAMYAQTATTATPQAMPNHQMPSPEDMAKRQTDRLNGMVKLNDAQSKSVYQANLDFANKLQAARQSNDRAAFKTAQDDREAQYKKILTPDQYNTYNQQKTQMMQNRAAMPKPGVAPAPVSTPAQ